MTDANKAIVNTFKETEEEINIGYLFKQLDEQGWRCRNCNSKSILSLYFFNKETGNLIPNELVDDFDQRDIEMFLLCKKCIKKLKNIKEIKTYEWNKQRLWKRDEKLDEKWHRRVYGSG